MTDLDDLYDDGSSDVDYDTPAQMPEDHSEALERCSWHLRMAAAAHAEQDELEALYRAEMDRLQERLAHRQRIIQQRIDWHEEPVRSFHLALLSTDPKRKTIEFPHGTSKVVTPKTPRLEFTDKAATLTWAEQNHPEILGHTINVTGVKQVAVPLGLTGSVHDTNGETIPGVEAVLDPPRWNASYQN